MSIQQELKILFTHPQTAYGSFPFSKIDHKRFVEYNNEALSQLRAQISDIENNAEAPTFQNSVEALEQAGEALEGVLSVFYNLLGAAADDDLMDASEEIATACSQLSSDILQSPKLYARVKAVYDQMETLSLSEEDKRLCYRRYKSFEKGGACLSDDKKEELKKINQQLSVATLSFGNHLLKERKLFRHFFAKDDPDIKDLPAEILATTKERAEKENKGDGYLFTLDAPEYIAIQTYCPNEEVRKLFYITKMKLGNNNNEYSNVALLKQIANLRLQKATLLGYSSYAEYALEERMLNTPDKVWNFLKQLEQHSRGKCKQELTQLKENYAANAQQLQPWNVEYYFERHKETTCNYNENDLRAYFPLNYVVEGVFEHFSNLYGIRFTKDDNEVEPYADKVQVYKVEEENGDYLGLLYLDFFPRDGKREGAWMNNLQEQIGCEGKRPHILIVMNFTPPANGEEALLTPREIHTFLHELGHALHGMLSKCKYASLSGTNVTRDFVELASQINENWLEQAAFVKRISRHYKTGDSLPQELLSKMCKAPLLRTGYDTQRQLAFGFLDMCFHSITEPLADDWNPEAFEQKAVAMAEAFIPFPQGTLMSTSFSHLFSGGYAAGYYGYKWSEVLSTDAFARYLEEPGKEQEVGRSFRKEILEKGDVQEANVLYKNFRGKEPSIDALLKRDELF